MNKTQMTVELLERRIARGDYCSELPSERILAEEFSVSRPTIRAALENLINDGVLSRRQNGRICIAETSRPASAKVIGFAIPPHLARDLELWRIGFFEAVEGTGAILRMLTYTHWEDIVLSDALKNFDGLFILPPSENVPRWLVEKFKHIDCKVVILDQNETAAGLPSVVMFPPKAEYKLFDYLVEQGHQRIDCINTQPGNPVINQRIKSWENYIEEKGLNGRLLSREMFQPTETSYLLVKDLMSSGSGIGSAVYCTTGPAAIGAMRALQEAGVEIGKDVSICTVNDEGMGRYLLKTLTSLEVLPRAPYLKKPVEWMLGEGDWKGPKLIQPDEVPLFLGETTGGSQDG